MIDYLLLDRLKRHGYYKGRLREVYEPILQERLVAGEKLYLFNRPDLMDSAPEGIELPGLLVTSLGDADGSTPSWLFELTITPKMALELKASNLQLNDEFEGEEEVWIPWTRSCSEAPITQLCCACWQPMIEVLRKRDYKDLQYPYICNNCGEVYGYKQLTEDTRDDVEAGVNQRAEAEERFGDED